MSEQVALSNTALPPRSSADFPTLPVVIKQLQQHLQLLLLEEKALLKRIRLIRHTIAGLADIFGPDILNEELSDSVANMDAASASVRMLGSPKPVAEY